MKDEKIGMDVFAIIHAHHVADNEIRTNLIDQLMAERDELQRQVDFYQHAATLYANGLAMIRDADDMMNGKVRWNP